MRRIGVVTEVGERLGVDDGVYKDSVVNITTSVEKLKTAEGG